MTVKTAPLIGLDFYRGHEYEREEYPDPIFEMNADSHIPIPSEGEYVTFGRVYDDEGEELDRWHYMDSSKNYEHSDRYRVVEVERHYHNARETDDDGNFVTRRPEVTVTILLEDEWQIP